MKSIVCYEYGLGTFDEIKFRVDELELFPEISGLIDRFFEERGIFIPKVIGVYQRKELIPEREPEREFLKKLNEFHRDIVSVQDSSRESISFKSDLSNLIFVAYDPSSIPLEIVRDLLNEDSGRIAIGSMDSVPDFYRKDSYLFNRDECERVNLREFRKMRAEYGLTELENAVLTGLESMAP